MRYWPDLPLIQTSSKTTRKSLLCPGMGWSTRCIRDLCPGQKTAMKLSKSQSLSFQVSYSEQNLAHYCGRTWSWQGAVARIFLPFGHPMVALSLSFICAIWTKISVLIIILQLLDFSRIDFHIYPLVDNWKQSLTMLRLETYMHGMNCFWGIYLHILEVILKPALQSH